MGETRSGKTDFGDLLFSPTASANAGLNYLKKRRATRGIGVPLGLPRVDKVYLPLLPDELELVVARPGNGKTTFLLARALNRAARLRSDPYMQDRVVVYVTAEQTVEDLWAKLAAARSQIALDRMARGDLTDPEMLTLEDEALEMGDLPIWIVAPSVAHRRKMLPVTPQAIIDTCWKIQDGAASSAQPAREIDLILVDYLQLLGADRGIDHPSETVRYSRVLRALKDAARAVGAPMVLASQARREVDDQATPIPGLRDSQWTSTAEQFADRYWGLVRPAKYFKQGNAFGKMSLVVSGHAQLGLSLLKQKMGEDNKMWWVEMDPAFTTLEDGQNRRLF